MRGTEAVEAQEHRKAAAPQGTPCGNKHRVHHARDGTPCQQQDISRHNQERVSSIAPTLQRRHRMHWMAASFSGCTQQYCRK